MLAEVCSGTTAVGGWGCGREPEVEAGRARSKARVP